MKYELPQKGHDLGCGWPLWIAKADLEGADSWKLSAHPPFCWAGSFSLKGICMLHLCLPQGGGLSSSRVSGGTNGFYRILFHIYNTPLSIKLNGFPCFATQSTSLRLWLSVSLPIKQGGWMCPPVLKSGDSYPSACCILHSQLCRKQNTAHLLLRASYQIQTQTDTVWLSCSCDLLTPFRRKHQVVSELWQ